MIFKLVIKLIIMKLDRIKLDSRLLFFIILLKFLRIVFKICILFLKFSSCWLVIMIIL